MWQPFGFCGAHIWLIGRQNEICAIDWLWRAVIFQRPDDGLWFFCCRTISPLVVSQNQTHFSFYKKKKVPGRVHFSSLGKLHQVSTTSSYKEMKMHQAKSAQSDNSQSFFFFLILAPKGLLSVFWLPRRTLKHVSKRLLWFSMWFWPQKSPLAHIFSSLSVCFDSQDSIAVHI